MLYTSLCPVQRCDSTFKWVTTAFFQILHAPRRCPWTRSRFIVYHTNSAFETASLNKQTIAVLSISARRHNFRHSTLLQCIGQASQRPTSSSTANPSPAAPTAWLKGIFLEMHEGVLQALCWVLRTIHSSPSTLPTRVGVLKCWGKKWRGRLRVSVSDPFYDSFYR